MNIKNRVEKIENQLNEDREETAENRELSRRITEARERMKRAGYKFPDRELMERSIRGGKFDIATMLQTARERRIKAETQRGKGNRQSVKK